MPDDFYIIRNSEDGVFVTGPLSQQVLLEEVTEATSEDLMPQYRAEFIDSPPNDYTDTNKWFILRGEVVIPKPVERVVEYTLD